MKRTTVHELLAESRGSLLRLQPQRALAAMQEGAILVDTRCGGERANNGSIPGSVHIPLSVLEWRVDPDSGDHDPAIGAFDSLIILICAHGFSSSLAARRLQDLGFVNATDVIGGFAAWKDAGLPVERSRE